MRIYKKCKAFISLVCVLSLLLPGFVIPVVAGDGKTVTATTSETVKQGSSGTCYVYIDSTESLAALDVTVHFDPAKVKVNSVYNSVSAVLYDNAKNTDNIQFNYILDGKGSTSKTRLFYFYYQVLSGAEVGDTYFDITIGEAYDSTLNDVAVLGSRTKFTITETVTSKTCTVSSTSSVNTSVEKEFSLSYRFSTYQIASGSAEIQYDPELFAVVSVTNGDFLANKIADVNTELSGSVYLSFAGTEYNTKYSLVTVTFKTLKNVSEASKITFKATELCDKDLNGISCKDYVTTANISFDETYVLDAPKMSVSASFDSETKKVTAKILLEADSHLGAGDFVLSFDPAVLTLSSWEKGFAPSFFNINDKETAEGKLKFSVISMEDIISAETVLTLAFDADLSCVEKTAEIAVDGSMLGDSMTEPIALNFIDDSVTLPAEHAFGEWEVETEATPAKEGMKKRTCILCGEKELEVIPQVDPLAIKGTSLLLQDNLAINYKVDKALFEETGYTDPYIIFTMNGKETKVDSYTVDGDRYVFRFSNIAPQQMGDTITSTLYADFNGIEYASASRDYSVTTYCYSMLPYCSNAKYAELGTLLVDLLHYGAASQLYANYKTDALVDAALTEEQLSWGTAADPALETVLDVAYETVENPEAQWKGAGLYLEDSVTLRFKLSVESPEGLTIKVRGETKTWMIPASELVETNGGYYLYFDKLDAGQMSEKLYLTVYKGEEAVSNTVCYSIESYAQEKQNSTIPNLAELVKAMMKYGNSAYAYAN